MHMIHTQVLGGPGCGRPLVESLLLEGDRKCLRMSHACTFHCGDHQRAVDAARQEGAERHIRHQAHLHGAVDQSVEFFDQFALRAGIH